MRSFSRPVIALLVVLVLAVTVVAAGCASAPEPAAQPSTNEPGTTDEPNAEQPAADDPGAVLVEQKCTMCHTLDRVNDASYDRAGWTSTIERMEKNGLVISADEKAAIIEYLSGR